MTNNDFLRENRNEYAKHVIEREKERLIALEKARKEAKEVNRRKIFSCVDIVTIEYSAWKVVGNAWSPFSFGPFFSEETAKEFEETQFGAVTWKYIHRETFYEREGLRVK